MKRRVLYLIILKIFITKPLLDQLTNLIYFLHGDFEEYDYLVKKFGKGIVNNFGGLRSCFWGDLGKEFYKTKTQNLKKEYGNYILIVSNLATFNSFLGKQKDLELESSVNFLT